MATAAHNALTNFEWRIAAISPTDGGRPFRVADPFVDEIGNESGAKRRFVVSWMESDAIAEPTDMYQRIASHTVQVTVYYPIAGAGTWPVLRQTVLQDRHSLIGTLRDPAKFVGYSDSASTADNGIWARVFIGDSLDLSGDADDMYEYTQRWRCDINEVE